jgi:hypothetical protein
MFFIFWILIHIELLLLSIGVSTKQFFLYFILMNLKVILLPKMMSFGHVKGEILVLNIHERITKLSNFLNKNVQ